MKQLKRQFKIDGRVVGDNSPTYIIAEMSANHGQDLEKAKDLVYAAKEAGADAIKLQSYRADTLTMDCKSDHFFIKEGMWKGQYLYDLYESAHMPWEWHEILISLSRKIGITCFSSPFDVSSIELLESLNVPAYKIASPEIIDIPLIRRVAQTGKPLIISTGSATIAEINEALDVATTEGAEEIALLKCTSTYPAPPNMTNLKTIPHMSDCFRAPVGLSDHTLGIAVPIASVAFGACLIEKHFVLSKEDDTADSFFSLTPDELKLMVDSVRIAKEAVGEVCYPMKSNNKRRALYAARDIAAGEILSVENIVNLRPGGELLPKELQTVIGRKAQTDIARGTPLKWEMIGS